MKICYINPAILLRRPIAELIKDLCKDPENEIGLLIPKKIFHPLDNSLHYSKMPKNVRIYTYSTLKMPGNFEWPLPTPWIFIQLIKIFRKYSIIHMWAHFYLANLDTNFIKIFFPKKKLILTMDTLPGYSFSSGKAIDSMFKIYTKILGWFMYGIPDMITLYGKSLVPFAKQSKIDLSKVKVLPTGIDLHKFDSMQGDIKKEFKIPENKKIILYVGLLNSRKGIDIILKTISEIKYKDFVLMIVGDGPKRKEYEELAKSMHLENKVIFTGFRKDVGRFYKSSEVLFFPSRGEGLAGVIMEAMICGLPVLTTDIPCTPDLIEDQKSGFLCQIDDTACFKQRISQLLKDKTLAEKISNASKQKIAKYSWEKRIPPYKEMYESISQKQKTSHVEKK